MHDLAWSPAYSLLDGLKDSYEHDFKHKKAAGAAGKLETDFSCEDRVLSDKRPEVLSYAGMPSK